MISTNEHVISADLLARHHCPAATVKVFSRDNNSEALLPFQSSPVFIRFMREQVLQFAAVAGAPPPSNDKPYLHRRGGRDAPVRRDHRAVGPHIGHEGWWCHPAVAGELASSRDG